MTEKIVVRNMIELDKYRKTIIDNLSYSIENIREIINNDALDIFKVFKFDKIAAEPLTGNKENLIEVINQTHTYLISIMAVEYLYEIYPSQKFVINWGNISGYDIESVDGSIIAECFAATSYKSNGKLTADLKRLVSNNTATYKYEFFYDKEFTDKHKEFYQEKYPGIEVIKFNEIY